MDPIWLGDEKQRDSVLRTPEGSLPHSKNKLSSTDFRNGLFSFVVRPRCVWPSPYACTSSNQILQGSLVFEKVGGAWESLGGEKNLHTIDVFVLLFFPHPVEKMFSYHLSSHDLFACSEDLKHGNRRAGNQQDCRDAAVTSKEERLHCAVCYQSSKVFVHVGYHPCCRRVVAPLLISTENDNVIAWKSQFSTRGAHYRSCQSSWPYGSYDVYMQSRCVKLPLGTLSFTPHSLTL